ncbi:TPA: hypothetical protein HA241_03665 [Candidatus Woesearchaeota archaeon]|nr:hypothetical protein [Candidatus Woesearchaeota archaeon]
MAWTENNNISYNLFNDVSGVVLYSGNAAGNIIDSNNFTLRVAQNRGVFLPTSNPGQGDIQGANTITNNRFIGNLTASTYGIRSDTNLTTAQNITANTFEGLPYAIALVTNQTSPIIVNNSFSGNGYHIYLSALESKTGNPLNVTAENNWYGTTNYYLVGDNMSDSVDTSGIGTVDYCPLLNASYPTGFSGDCELTYPAIASCKTLTRSGKLNQSITFNGTCFTINANNLFLDGGGYTIIGNRSGDGITNNGFDNITIKNFGGIINTSNGIYSSDMENLTVINNTIRIEEIAQSRAVQITYGTNGSRIMNNTFNVSGTNAQGIAIEVDSINNVVFNNTIYAFNSSAHAVSLWNYSRLNNITNNTLVSNGSGAGIIIHQVSTANLIEGNFINVTGSSGYGLDFIDGSDNLTARKNVIVVTGNGSNGIYLENSSYNIIVNNSVNNYGDINSQGIFFTKLANFNNLSNNIVMTNGTTSVAMYIDNSSSGKFLNNTLTTKGASSLGIQIRYANNNEFTANTINASGYGINIQTNSENNTIVNTTVFSTATEPLKDESGLSFNNALMYSNSFGLIYWNKTNLTTGINLSINDTLFLKSGIVGLIDTSIQALNGSAKIEFYGLTFSSAPYLFKRGLRCDNSSDCNVSYNNVTGILLANVSSFSNYTLSSDIDNDTIPDDVDTLVGTSTNVNATGVSSLNITIGGNSTNGTFTGVQEVVFFDGTVPLINFSHNFSNASINLSKVEITLSTTGIIVNMSGQLEPNQTKSLLLNNPGFTNVCLKNMDIGSLSEVSNSCTGVNETDFTNCLSNGTGLRRGNFTCYTSGSLIRIENLSYSAIRGILPAASQSSSSSASSGSGSGAAGVGICGDAVCNDGELCAVEGVNQNGGPCFKDCCLCPAVEEEKQNIAPVEQLPPEKEKKSGITFPERVAAFVGQGIYQQVKEIVADYSLLWLGFVAVLIVGVGFSFGIMNYLHRRKIEKE